jgi:hypothetical protein
MYGSNKWKWYKKMNKKLLQNTRKKPISKNAQLKEDRKINNMILKKFEAQELAKDRMIEDKKDKINTTKEKIGTTIDLSKFNSTQFNEALKSSGINTTSSNVFEDMERMVNNNESIRELVDNKNIKMKTRVTEEQHKIIVILRGSYLTLKYRYGIEFIGLRDILSEFIELSPSIDGERAGQFVTAHQAVAQAVANANQGHNNQIRDSSDMKN